MYQLHAYLAEFLSAMLKKINLKYESRHRKLVNHNSSWQALVGAATKVSKHSKSSENKLLFPERCFLLSFCVFKT